MDVEAASEGAYDIGWISAGEWLAYSVKVAAGGSYLLEARVASLGQGGTFHIESAGTNLTGALTIPNSGGWQAWTTVSKLVSLAAGPQVLKVVFDTAGPSCGGQLQLAPSLAGRIDAVHRHADRVAWHVLLRQLRSGW